MTYQSTATWLYYLIADVVSDADLRSIGRAITTETVELAAAAQSRPCEFCHKPIDSGHWKIPRYMRPTASVVIVMPKSQRFCSMKCQRQFTMWANRKLRAQIRAVNGV